MVRGPDEPGRPPGQAGNNDSAGTGRGSHLCRSIEDTGDAETGKQGRPTPHAAEEIKSPAVSPSEPSPACHDAPLLRLRGADKDLGKKLLPPLAHGVYGTYIYREMRCLTGEGWGEPSGVPGLPCPAAWSASSTADRFSARLPRRGPSGLHRMAGRIRPDSQKGRETGP